MGGRYCGIDVVDRDWDVFVGFWHRGLTLAYRAFVHPVAEYGSILMMEASDTQLSKLDHMQHFAAQLFIAFHTSSKMSSRCCYRLIIQVTRWNMSRTIAEILSSILSSTSLPRRCSV